MPSITTEQEFGFQHNLNRKAIEQTNHKIIMKKHLLRRLSGRCLKWKTAITQFTGRLYDFSGSLGLVPNNPEYTRQEHFSRLNTGLK